MPNEKIDESHLYRLDQYEGPLDLLVYLIQKDELEIFDLVLKTLSFQLMKKMEQSPFFIEEGGEALWLIATLAYIKSKKLLPQEEKNADEEQEEFKQALIDHLIEYHKYKNAAHFLEKREAHQSSYFCRKVPLPQIPKQLGLEQVHLSDLAQLLQLMLQNAQSKTADFAIKKEKWTVGEKIISLQKRLQPGDKIAFSTLFTSELCREELIILFLALLELIKGQKLGIYKEEEKIFVYNQL